VTCKVFQDREQKAGGERGTLFPFMEMLKKESSETIL
jgi:hypothetical protein